ncbi:hypothetical protein ACFQY7_40775 [Actinomadura luteofluorescens]|uniref:hypothetical protein n=1 Tax=Actinomadura luteofluorescens TaxID=46163 RepID=UPI0036444F44
MGLRVGRRLAGTGLRAPAGPLRRLPAVPLALRPLLRDRGRRMRAERRPRQRPPPIPGPITTAMARAAASAPTMPPPVNSHRRVNGDGTSGWLGRPDGVSVPPRAAMSAR